LASSSAVISGGFSEYRRHTSTFEFGCFPGKRSAPFEINPPALKLTPSAGTDDHGLFRGKLVHAALAHVFFF
jgi:hypothetical protein